VTDEQLADRWERGALGRSITHEEHLRIAFVLLRRHGREDGTRRIDESTRSNSEALGAAEKYDGELTRRWSEALADALEGTGARDADELIRVRPEFLQSDLFGPPAWKALDG
jgi:hypothetical protein